MKDYSAVAFIPARKNSKRLPGKNKKLLNGKPLFMYTVEAAIKSNCYELVILSTDDDEIIGLASNTPGLTVVKRPSQYAGDEIKARDVVLYHLQDISVEFDYISLLMPTSPLRNEDDITESFKLLMENDGDSLVSVVEYDFHPRLSLKIMDNKLVSYFDKQYQWVRESEFEKAYHLNGGIFTARKNLFLESKSFIHNGTIPYLMGSAKSVDIDSELDFAFADFLIRSSLV